jgi:hypothetical protein
MLMFFFTGTSVRNWFGFVKEKVERTNFQNASNMLIYLFQRLDIFFNSLRLEFWRTSNNIVVEHNISNPTEDVESETQSEEDHILPCIQQRLQRLENAFTELSHRPADIPMEKEKMLMSSLDRIKSVEFDLENTKRVILYTFFSHIQLLTVSSVLNSDDMIFNCFII